MRFCNNHSNRKIFSKKLCIECYKKAYPYKIKRKSLKKKVYYIKPIADKRAKKLRIYGKRRKAFLKLHTTCEIKGHSCTIRATEVHHTDGREGILLFLESKWKAVCHKCHVKITEHSKQAIKDGHSNSRYKK